MSGAIANKVETGAVAVAAAALGCAVAFAVLMVLQPDVGLAFRSLVAAGAGAAASIGAWRLVSAIGAQGRVYNFAAFDPPLLDAQPAEEPLELTEAHQSPLILDDVLDAVGPDARVVRLFDPSAMPSPAELKARVDRYLGQGASWAKSPDASQALVDALTELRRSLR